MFPSPVWMVLSRQFSIMPGQCSLRHLLKLRFTELHDLKGLIFSDPLLWGGCRMGAMGVHESPGKIVQQGTIGIIMVKKQDDIASKVGVKRDAP